MSAEQMRALAGRVEQASGADRTLDADIAAICDAPGNDDLDRNSEVFWQIVERVRGGADDCEIAYYTASLDAAMLLVPSLGKWSITSASADHGWEAWVWLTDGAPPDWRSASTPALALTAACLRARASLLDKEPQDG